MSKLSFTRNAVRVVTVIVMIAIVAIATADGFAQSYSGLYEWAELHKLSGWKADSFPLLVDLFILVGELGLFLLALDGYRLRKRSLLSWTDLAFPAAVAAAGWGVSLWFNVNHIPNATTEDKVTAGVPPVAAMVGLFIMLRTVHRYMAQLEDQEKTPEPAPEPMPEIGALSGLSVPSLEDQSRKALSAPETAGTVPVWHPSGTITDEPETRPEPPVSDAEAAMVEAVEALLDKVPDPEPEPSPEPPSTNGRTPYGKGPGHPKWDEGVKIYRESVESPGKALSQRDLAEALGMRNRSLAAAIIKHVKGEKTNEHGDSHDLPEATDATPPEES
jgi:hypothetical protein